jgi:hypothetical protein
VSCAPVPRPLRCEYSKSILPYAPIKVLKVGRDGSNLGPWCHRIRGPGMMMMRVFFPKTLYHLDTPSHLPGPICFTRFHISKTSTTW